MCDGYCRHPSFHLTDKLLYRIKAIKGIFMAITGIKFDQKQERLAKMLKALGNPVRFQIIEFLAQKKVCITSNIVEATPLSAIDGQSTPQRRFATQV